MPLPNVAVNLMPLPNVPLELIPLASGTFGKSPTTVTTPCNVDIPNPVNDITLAVTRPKVPS